MLLQFKVENFRSYAAPAALSLVRGTKQRSAGDDQRIIRSATGGPDVLRAAAIFGPNAGGKSNFLKAMLLLQRAVLRSAAEDNALAFDAFATPEFASKPVNFEIEFIVGENEFQYRASFANESVVQESLSSKALGSRAANTLLFQRSEAVTETAANITFAGALKGHPDIAQWQRNTRPHQLFLSQSQNLSSAPLLLDPFDWFRKTLRTLKADARNLASFTIRRLGDELYKRRLVNELISADLGITEVNVLEALPPDKFVMAMDSAHTLREAYIEFVHAPSIGPTFDLDFKEESDGTRFFFSLLGPLDDVIQNDRILLVDELDRSLHPLLVRKIVRAFAQGNSKSQLIFTTHDATLLDAEVLRRDQVWFAERNTQQQSSLRRLAQGNVRMDKALMRAYLDGQFQGVPIIGSEGTLSEE
jgi:uncharacterized protein